MTLDNVPAFIYKIATKQQWQKAISAGVFKGAPIDLEDGYIHFSTASQAVENRRQALQGSEKPEAGQGCNRSIGRSP